MRGGALALLAASCAALGGGCGGSDGDADAKLLWVGEVRILHHPTLPRDRILRGTVRNEGSERIELAADDIRLLDASGAEIPASAVFLEGYVKPLESRNRPSRETAGERLRRGLGAVIEPGGSAPITVSWRRPRGARKPDRIDAGPASLMLP